ncbi:Uncharacterised protein [Staphylococcus aureus]|nr:Uncharacterised protein [Staphylococcus aureus]
MFISTATENGSAVRVTSGCALLITTSEAVRYVNFSLKSIFLGVSIFATLTLYDNFKDLSGNKTSFVCVPRAVVTPWLVNVTLFAF